MEELARIAAFRTLSEAGRRLLDRGAAVHRFTGGKTIIEKGQTVSGAYFVVQGRLRVFSLLPGGKEVTLYLIEPGETCVLALNSLFNNLLYPAWVQAELPTTVALVPGGTYRSLFATEPAVQDLTVRTLSTLVFRLMAELDLVHSSTVGQRLAGFLLVRASDKGVVRHTQQEIAGHMGTTREMVARLIGRMVNGGMIQSGRGRITLLDRAALAEMARSDEED